MVSWTRAAGLEEDNLSAKITPGTQTLRLCVKQANQTNNDSRFETLAYNISVTQMRAFIDTELSGFWFELLTLRKLTSGCG